MKTTPFALVCTLSLAFVSACSTMQGGKSGQDIAMNGPTVLSARTNPGTFDLNQNLQPKQSAEVLADVKDFNHNITNVTLRFTHVPMEIAMQQMSPSTWRAELSPDQLKKLAVNGQTMRYEASVIAKNDSGQTSISNKPLTIAVKAPDLQSNSHASADVSTQSSDNNIDQQQAGQVPTDSNPNQDQNQNMNQTENQSPDYSSGSQQ